MAGAFLTSDLPMFLDQDAFASACNTLTVTTTGSTVSTATGAEFSAIFDAGYQQVLGDEVASVKPTLTCRTTDVSSLAYQALLLVAGTQYRVAEIQPDGTGVTLLQLEKV